MNYVSLININPDLCMVIFNLCKTVIALQEYPIAKTYSGFGFYISDIQDISHKYVSNCLMDRLLSFGMHMAKSLDPLRL